MLNRGLTKGTGCSLPANALLVLVLGRCILVSWLMIGRGGLVGWSRLIGVRGSSHGNEGKEGDEGLQLVHVI